MRFGRPVTNSVLAMVLIASPLGLAQSPSGSAATFTIAQLKMPLSSFYEPGTKMISLKTKKALFDQAANAYIQKLPQLRPKEIPLLEKMSLFFIASEQNRDTPEAQPLFYDAVDLLIRKNEADQWSALKLIVELGDEHIEELHGKPLTKASPK